MTTYLAFRKNSDSLMAWLTRLWTGSRYSHVELVLDGGLGTKSTCFGAVKAEGRVRTAVLMLSAVNWDVLPVKFDMGRVAAMQEKLNGAPYDFRGILGVAVPDAGQDRKAWFCSELVAHALRLDTPAAWTPQDLYEWAVEAK